jgi:hypothetical protein
MYTTIHNSNGHPLLGNGSINTHSWQQKRCFLWIHPWDYISSPAWSHLKYSHVEAGSNTSTVALRVVGGNEKASLESETVKYCCESHGTQNQEWMHWWGPAAIVNDRPILLSGRMLYKDYDQRCSFEKKNSGHESQGARCQDELIEGKPPVIK